MLVRKGGRTITGPVAIYRSAAPGRRVRSCRAAARAGCLRYRDWGAPFRVPGGCMARRPRTIYIKYSKLQISSARFPERRRIAPERRLRSLSCCSSPQSRPCALFRPLGFRLYRYPPNLFSGSRRWAIISPIYAAYQKCMTRFQVCPAGLMSGCAAAVWDSDATQPAKDFLCHS